MTEKKVKSIAPPSLPSILAFERKLDPSDGLLFSGRWDERADAAKWPEIKVREKAVRGTISHWTAATDTDAAKLKHSKEDANLQRVDIATLPFDADTLKTVFTLKVHGGVGQPCACNDKAFRQKLEQAVSAYSKANGFTELSCRYAQTLANGGFLWRNRCGSEDVEIKIERLVAGVTSDAWVFDGFAHSTSEFLPPERCSPDLRALASAIEQGLSGTANVIFRVTAFARMGPMREVYPSQEMVADKKDAKDKSKTLYQVEGVAGMHSQKLGNAIRTIDTWYGKEASSRPIAIEPYGAVTTEGEVYRPRTSKDDRIAKIDLYSLLEAWLLSDEAPALSQQHFVIANLIRGGVFGGESRKGKKQEEGESEE